MAIECVHKSKKRCSTAYTPGELRQMLKASEIEGARVLEIDEHHIAIEREAQPTRTTSVSVREQYR